MAEVLPQLTGAHLFFAALPPPQKPIGRGSFALVYLKLNNSTPPKSSPAPARCGATASSVGSVVSLDTKNYLNVDFRVSESPPAGSDDRGRELDNDVDTTSLQDQQAWLDGKAEHGSRIELFLPPGAVLSEDMPLKSLPGSNIYLGPYAHNSRVKQAEFVKSSKCVNDCPDRKLPEFAMVGRSNVGKSSLINALVQRKDLAQTSKKPGKTQFINHFIVNNSWYLVDLPGYGYAKVPVGVRASWNDFTKDYFLQSKNLVCVMLLVDASIPPQKIDLEYAVWLHQNKVPLTLVFTKCDRKKKKKNGGRKPEENLEDFLNLLKESLDVMPPWIMTSCVTNQGRDALLMHMAQLRNYWKS